MADRRRKDVVWDLPESGIDWDHVRVALLMDIRDELKRINSVLHCSNCLAIPQKLDRIAANTHKPKRRRRRKPAPPAGGGDGG
jgi:hypothetical protein